MGAQVTHGLADELVAKLRAHEPELRAAGIRHLSLFGSAARGDSKADNDIDLAVDLDPDAHIDLFRLAGLQQRLAELLGRPVDLLPEPVEKHRLQVNIDRDRRNTF